MDRGGGARKEVDVSSRGEVDLFRLGRETVHETRLQDRHGGGQKNAQTQLKNRRRLRLGRDGKGLSDLHDAATSCATGEKNIQMSSLTLYSEHSPLLIILNG